MCINTDQNKDSKAASSDSSSKSTAIISVLTIAVIGLAAAAIALGVNRGETKETTSTITKDQILTTKPGTQIVMDENPCEGKKPTSGFENIECAFEETGEQAGANVTKGYNGKFNTTAVPITVPYYQVGMCPVNVHWHLGAEHYSAGQYDESGTGPSEINERRKLAGKTRQGYQCTLFDAQDEMFTKEYEWQHCIDMEVGQTYEIHWPHSAAGACSTPYQYQTPFYDGVFCRDGVLTDTAGQIGVQAQVFTIVNDESFYFGDLLHGMIVDGEMGTDLAMYTGSTTGTSRDNTICSAYSPITWQVDRKCHLISASSFDKLCADMKAQRDDMSDDLYAHGSRELVADHLAANNHANLRRA